MTIRYKDITGMRFGRVTVVRRSSISVHGVSKWECLCDCGNTVTLRRPTLLRGTEPSCGCYSKELLSARNFTHGKSKTKTYTVWVSMKSRCYYPNYIQSADYAGRGIAVCDRWKDSFKNFLEDMGECPDGKTLDRIDNDGNYEPGNCRWATQKEQSRNTRRNRYIKVGNKVGTVAEIAEHFKLNYYGLHKHISRNGDEGFQDYLEYRCAGSFSQGLETWNNPVNFYLSGDNDE